MANFVNCDSDIEDIPEIDLTLNIQPYMSEPIGNAEYSPEPSSTKSDSDDDVSLGDQEDQMPSQASSQSTDRCSCGKCIAMANDIECKCCQDTNEIKEKMDDADHHIECITDHDGFIANCLKQYVLETSFYEYVEDNGRLRPSQLVHRVYRYILYKRCVRWIWQRLRKHNRRILPSCVVTAIRRKFPSQQYCGFQYSC